MSATPATINSELTVARDELRRLTAAANALSALSAPKHWTETDPAVVSGIRRKPNARADARRFAKFDREAAAWARVREQQAIVQALENRAERAKREAPVPFTDHEYAAARYVRDRHGWHKVWRINAKSVTVTTEWSWTERIARADVLEVRP